MAKTVGLGIQSFEKLIEGDSFYIDKTDFIRQWWENQDDVTLITRPRRFGKTLTMNTLERFLSAEYAGQGEIFEGLSIWKEEKYRKLQGTWPVISLSFADVKAVNFDSAKEKIFMLIREVYSRHDYLLAKGILKEEKSEFFRKVFAEMTDSEAAYSLKNLSSCLADYYGKPVIILLDEYDTPLQEAWVYGYWEEMAEFIRGLFNASFKSNLYLGRAVMTGITRISKESVFSDLNHLTVVTSTSELYSDCFGFTETEVFTALDEYGMGDRCEAVKKWYDGFSFGKHGDIYNPWSILNFLKFGKLSTYWANTSSNSLVDKLIREGSAEIKSAMEDLLRGGHLYREIDEQIIFDQLGMDENAVWSLFLASGYLKAENYTLNEDTGTDVYELALTNKEVEIMFRKMIKKWFSGPGTGYNGFISALLADDVKSMNAYMNRIALATFSYFDSGKKPSMETQPERLAQSEAMRFIIGFVLGLIVELADRYSIMSNRESGFGRYDVMLEPLNRMDNAMIMEFKVKDSEEEASLEDTADAALKQIEKKQYQLELENREIARSRIRKYGFAFEGKNVLIKGFSF